MSGKKRIPELIESAVVSDYTSGMRAGDVAAKHCINRKTVTMLVREAA